MAQATLQKIEPAVPQSEKNPQSEPLNREERIRARAYEFYASRNYEEGHAEDDWFRAEAEISEELGETSH